MKNQFILYTHPVSANGRKVVLLTKLLAVEPEIKLINVYKGEGQNPEYLKVHPLGQIPLLVNLQNGQTVSESNGILMVISEVFGDSAFYAKDANKKAAIHQWLFWESSQWQPALSSVLREIVGHELVPHYVPAPSGEPNWSDPTLKRQLAYLESHLSHQAFLAGNELTIADLSVSGMMTYFRFSGFPFKEYPAISRWFDTIEGLPAWQQTQDPLWDK